MAKKMIDALMACHLGTAINSCHKKTMKLAYNIDRVVAANAKADNVDIKSIYRLEKTGLPWKLMALHVQKLSLPGQSIWYGDWKQNIDEYDTIIVFGCHFNWNVLDYIKSKNSHARLIVWFWDTISKRYWLPEKYYSMAEVWSFDPIDCSKYKMKQNTQFYVYKNIETGKEAYDALYVGRDKGRVSQINTICDAIKASGLTVNQYIVATHEKSQSTVSNIEIHDKPLEYEEYLQLLSQVRCVIDVPKDIQNGLTLRVLESICHNKKLITTNKRLINESFYNPNNILIWDNPTQEDLIAFFAKPYEPVDEEIRNYYLFDSWLNRFFEEQ